MDEFQLIQQLKQKHYRQSSLLKGVGDDAAVIRTDEDLVTAIDTFVEGVHFTQKTMDYFHVGYRTLAANVSDMAAMGANPTFYLVSIVIPNHMLESDVHTLYDGMKAMADQFHMDLIGGDTVAGDRLIVTITIIGTVGKNKARYRHDAKIDDLIFVTGRLGDASCGLHLLLHDIDVKDREHFIEAHRMPRPRVHFAQQLQSINRVCLNDISDGIANELHEIAEASQISMEINEDHIPLHPSMNQFTRQEQMQFAYFGGEDFELVGTIGEKDIDALYEAGKQTNTTISIIGKVVAKADAPVYLRQVGKRTPLEKDGYIHLK